MSCAGLGTGCLRGLWASGRADPREPGQCGGTIGPGRGLLLSVTGAALADSLEEDSPSQPWRHLSAARLRGPPPQGKPPVLLEQFLTLWCAHTCPRLQGREQVRGHKLRVCVAIACHALLAPGPPAACVGGGLTAAGCSHPPAPFTQFDED